MRVYLDTSAINELAKQPRYRQIIRKIGDNFEPVFSIVNILELMSTKDKQMRTHLLHVAKLLIDKRLPYASYRDILQRSLEKFPITLHQDDYIIPAEEYGIIKYLRWPKKVSRLIQENALDLKSQEESWFKDMHTSARPHVQEAIVQLVKDDVPKIRSSATYLRHYSNNTSNLTEIMEDFIRALVPNREDLLSNAFDVLIKSEPWRFYLASFGVEAYSRSIKNSGFSKKVNAGSIDTQQMIYLAIIDAFITEDPYQKRTLRIIERFGDRRRNIWSTKDLIRAMN